MNRLLPLFFLTILLLSACSSGKKALTRGDYYSSVLKAVNRLRQSPNNKKAAETLAYAYPELISYNQDRIRQLSSSNNPFRWESVIELYKELNHAYDEVLRAPAASRVIRDPQSFRNEEDDALDHAAEARYDQGQIELDKSMMLEDRNAAKVAYRHFQKAFDLKPSFRDAEAKMLEARELATVYVLIEPIPIHSQKFGLTNEFFQNQMTEYIKNNTFSPFVEFFTLAEFDATGQQPDHVIQMIFDDFVVGQARIKEKVEERSADSVVVGQVEVVENGETVKKDVYGTVTAKMHRFEKTLTSSGLLDFRIYKPNRQELLSQKKFPGTYRWSDRWGYFNGDERALTKDDKRYLNHDREVATPSAQALFIEFTKPIFNQVTSYVKNYYERF